MGSEDMSDEPAATAGLRRASRRTMADEAYDAIVEAIVDRRLAPSEHLTMRGLAEQLDMSTTPIREALARLASQRLVSQITNRSCTVAPLLTEREYHQIFAVRRLLESAAITTAEPDETSVTKILDLARLMPHMEHGGQYREFQDFNQADRDFHLTLVQMARNPFLERAWHDLHFHLHVGRLYTGSGVIDFSDALHEHEAIAEAVASGSLDAAAELVTQHILGAESRLLELVPAFDHSATESEARS
jgi:DNA-binding GntR family transcriptional regulator